MGEWFPSRRQSEVVGNPDSGAGFWLFDPEDGWDLTHPASPSVPPVSPHLTMATTSGADIAIAPRKTALVVVDMQNLFLSLAPGHPPGPGHEAESRLLLHAIPAARKAGIRVVHVTWGISDEELAGGLPPFLLRGFGSYPSEPMGPPPPPPSSLTAPGGCFASAFKGGDDERTRSGRVGIGNDMGLLPLPDGSKVAAGRLLMRDQWNTELHEPLQKAFEASQATPLPHLRFHKSRHSGFWGGSTPVTEFLRREGITTLLFGGVNTDQCVLASHVDACSLGFDTVLLADGCGTTSPGCAQDMTGYNGARAWGFVSSCLALAKGAKDLQC